MNASARSFRSKTAEEPASRLQPAGQGTNWPVTATARPSSTMPSKPVGDRMGAPSRPANQSRGALVPGVWLHRNRTSPPGETVSSKGHA